MKELDKEQKEYEIVIKEANNKYNVGDNITCLEDGKNWTYDEEGFIFDIETNSLWCRLRNVCVFRNGKWADIVEEDKESVLELTVEDIEREMGCKVKIIK